MRIGPKGGDYAVETRGDTHVPERTDAAEPRKRVADGTYIIYRIRGGENAD